MPRLLLVAALLVFMAVPASAQDLEATAALRVRVYDAGSGLPIPGARVGLTDIGFFALTDTAGVALLTGIPPGLHELEVAMFGYETEDATLDFGPGSLAAGDVVLTFQPIPLEEIMVQGRSRWSARLQGSGFYERGGKWERIPARSRGDPRIQRLSALRGPETASHPPWLRRLRRSGSDPAGRRLHGSAPAGLRARDLRGRHAVDRLPRRHAALLGRGARVLHEPHPGSDRVHGRWRVLRTTTDLDRMRRRSSGRTSRGSPC